MKREGQNETVRGTKADPTGKGHIGQKKTLWPHISTHTVRGKAQKEMVQKKAMFIHWNLSHLTIEMLLSLLLPPETMLAHQGYFQYLSRHPAGS